MTRILYTEDTETFLINFFQEGGEFYFSDIYADRELEDSSEKMRCSVATTIEITTTIEIIISIVVENAFQNKHHIATTIEITTTIEIIISIVVENAFQT